MSVAMAMDLHNVLEKDRIESMRVSSEDYNATEIDRYVHVIKYCVCPVMLMQTANRPNDSLTQ